MQSRFVETIGFETKIGSNCNLQINAPHFASDQIINQCSNTCSSFTRMIRRKVSAFEA